MNLSSDAYKAPALTVVLLALVGGCFTNNVDPSSAYLLLCEYVDTFPGLSHTPTVCEVLDDSLDGLFNFACLHHVLPCCPFVVAVAAVVVIDVSAFLRVELGRGDYLVATAFHTVEGVVFDVALLDGPIAFHLATVEAVPDSDVVASADVVVGGDVVTPDDLACPDAHVEQVGTLGIDAGDALATAAFTRHGVHTRSEIRETSASTCGRG